MFVNVQASMCPVLIRGSYSFAGPIVYGPFKAPMRGFRVWSKASCQTALKSPKS